MDWQRSVLRSEESNELSRDFVVGACLLIADARRVVDPQATRYYHMIYYCTVSTTQTHCCADRCDQLASDCRHRIATSLQPESVPR